MTNPSLELSLQDRILELLDTRLFAVFVINDHGRVVESSAAVARLLDYPDAEFMGKEFQTFLHHDDVAAFQNTLATVSSSKEIPSYHVRCRHHSGTWRWLEILLRRTRRDASLIICEFHDITLTKLTAESLQDSLEWLTHVMDAFRDAVFIEENEKVAFINKAFVDLYGYQSADEIIGRNVAEFQAPEDSQQMLQYTRSRVEGKYAPQVYQFYGKKKDGSYLPLEASVSTLHFGSRNIIITIIHDLADPTLL